MSEDWVETTLASLLSLEYGKALPEKVRDGIGFPVLGSAGVVGMHSTPTVRGPGIVVGRKGTAGSVTWVDRDFSPIDTTYWVRLKSDSVSLEFTHLLLSALDLPSVCAQTGVPGLNRDRAYELPVVVPPLPVQRRIVDLMTHLDYHLANLRAERERLSDVLALTRAQMMDGSDLTPLAALAATDGIQIGPFGSQLHAYEYTVEGTPVVMPRDLVGGRVSTEKIKRVGAETVNRLERHGLQAGDIVFPRRGDLSKRALITSTEEGWLCGTGCIRFRPAASVDGAQVFQSISGSAVTDWLVEHAVGTTMLNLNSQIVSALPVAIPSEESAPLGAASLGLSECVDALGSEVTSLQAFRTALLASLLSGDRPVDSNYDGILGEVA